MLKRPTQKRYFAKLGRVNLFSGSGFLNTRHHYIPGFCLKIRLQDIISTNMRLELNCRVVLLRKRFAARL